MKLQSNQCTYSDLDCLLSFSNHDLSTALGYLAKIILICSSTLLYLAVSTYILTNSLIIIKHLTTSTSSVSSSGLDVSSPQFIIETRSAPTTATEKCEYALVALEEENVTDTSNHAHTVKSNSFNLTQDMQLLLSRHKFHNNRVVSSFEFYSRFVIVY